MAVSPPLHPLPDAAELEGLVNPEPSASAKLCFVDVETSGVDSEVHQIWEVAVITGDEEWQRFLEIDLSRASPEALRVNRYYQRHHAEIRPDEWRAPDPKKVAGEVARLTAGAVLVGIKPWFDATFLGAFLRRCKLAPAWEIQLIDVPQVIAGRFGVRPPWDSRELSHRLGVAPPADGDRHTALGDARWARAMYDAVMDRA